MQQNPARIIIITGISPKPGGLEHDESAFQATHFYRYHRNEEKQMDHMATEEQLLEPLVVLFLADLAHANHSPHTCRAYATDLAQFCAFHQGPVQLLTAEVLRTFFGRHAHLRPATIARTQAAIARFLPWPHHQDLLNTNPIHTIHRPNPIPPQPRP